MAKPFGYLLKTCAIPSIPMVAFCYQPLKPLKTLEIFGYMDRLANSWLPLNKIAIFCIFVHSIKSNGCLSKTIVHSILPKCLQSVRSISRIHVSFAFSKSDMLLFSLTDDEDVIGKLVSDRQNSLVRRPANPEPVS